MCCEVRFVFWPGGNFRTVKTFDIYLNKEVKKKPAAWEPNAGLMSAYK